MRVEIVEMDVSDYILSQGSTRRGSTAEAVNKRTLTSEQLEKSVRAVDALHEASRSLRKGE